LVTKDTRICSVKMNYCAGYVFTTPQTDRQTDRQTVTEWILHSIIYRLFSYLHSIRSRRSIIKFSINYCTVLLGLPLHLHCWKPRCTEVTKIRTSILVED
jgi:hypothetical protein